MKPFINTQEALYIAITAAEGGVNYWTPVTDYYIREDAEGNLIDPGANAVLFRVHDDQADLTDVDYGWRDVTIAVIKRGYKRFVADGRDLWDPNDPAGMDAGEADMVVQYGLFGEVVFG